MGPYKDWYIVRFITLIAKNVLHRPVRTILTTVGLAVAISAVVILVGISWNFQQSFMAIYQTKGIDLVVVRAGSSNQLSSSLDIRMGERLRKIEGVAEVSPSLVDTVGFEEKNLVAVLVNGWMPGSSLFRGVRIIEGRGIREGDEKVVMLGRVVAMTLEKKAGEPLQIAGVPFQVIGIFESDSWFENGGIVMPLEDASADDGQRGPGNRASSFRRRRPTPSSSTNCGTESSQRSAALPRRRLATTCKAIPRSAWRRPWPGRRLPSRSSSARSACSTRC